MKFQRDAAYIGIIVLLCVGLVYVATHKDTLNVFSCPMRLVNGVWRSAIANTPICIGAACPPASELESDVSVYVDKIGIGTTVTLRTSQVSPRELELVNNSHILMQIVNGSTITGDTRPSRIESGRFYISGKAVMGQPDPADFVIVQSEFDFVSPDQTTLKIQSVSYKLGGEAGIRLFDPVHPDRTTTLLSGGQIPRWVLGSPNSAFVYDNPSETIILPTGPITQVALACVDAPFTTSQTLLSITYAPPPSSCFRQKTGISTTTMVELSVTSPTVQPCIASALIVSAASVAFDVVAFPDVCFAASACDNVLRSDNITSLIGTQRNIRNGTSGQPVNFSIGCSNNRVLILCQQTRL